LNHLRKYLRQRARAYLRRRDWAWHLSRPALVSKWRLEQYRNIHAGERCFIIGNGPSLQQMDLSNLKNEYTFGMNRIYLMFDKLGFESTYFASVNTLVIEQCGADIAQLQMPKFISWRSREHIPFTDNLMFLRTMYGVGNFPFFSTDLAETVWEGATVTYVAMQIAYFMGFSQVILIGVDHNFATKGAPNTTITSTGDDPDHFDPNYFGKGFRWQLPDLDTSEFAYTVARYVYESDKREIFDATVGGKLQVFRKVPFTSLF